MSIKSRCVTTILVAASASAAVAFAPLATAAPECTKTSPNTTQCETNGSAQIVTSPPPNNNYGYWGFPIIGWGGGWGFGW
jgi:hypothetical protein